MKKYLFPIIVAILLALAALLGILQNDGRFESNKLSISGDKSLEEYYLAAKNLSKETNTPVEVSFLAVGDIMLSRGVASSIKRTGDPSWPFKNATGLLAETNFNFGNLESPLSESSYFSLSNDLKFNTPPGFADGLAENNFKIVNLANNHIMDQGKVGLDYTKNFLKNQQIAQVGAGDNSAESWQGQIVEINGIKTGFIGAGYGVNGSAQNLIALTRETEKLKSSIANLRSQADFIVVSMHAGEEYKKEPTKTQINFARAAIDAGADLVIGSHPHWIQPVEKYKDKYIFYSLGNFIFDQGWSRETKEGLAIKVTLAGTPKPSSNAAGIDALQGTQTGVRLKEIELVPVIIENYGQPRIANPEEAITILKKINIDTAILVP